MWERHEGKSQRSFEMNDTSGNVWRDGIRGMKERQGEEVEDVGERGTRESRRWIDGCILQRLAHSQRVSGSALLFCGRLQHRKQSRKLRAASPGVVTISTNNSQLFTKCDVSA